MLSSTNFWMSSAGLVCLVVALLVARKDISAARGWDKLAALGRVLVAVALATFAPEHFRGPEFIQAMVPPWMPAPEFWTYLVGCALLGAAISLAAGKFMRLSSTMLGLMFFGFVCMIYLPSVTRHPTNRFAWAIALRDLSFAGGAWALAGLHSRGASPRLSSWMIQFARFVIAISAVFYAVVHFLHPDFSPGVPLNKLAPAWMPFPGVWAYAVGAILLPAGIALALNKRPRIAAIAIGAVMTALTVFPYLAVLLLSRGSTEINVALNFVADTLLFAGTALVLASALPRDHPADQSGLARTTV